MKKTKTGWQKVWKGVEMDQEAREAKRDVKKKKIRKNRNSCKSALKHEKYDDLSVTDWESLDENDLN